MKAKLVYKGGPGSGHYGHRGIPGEQGGSLPKNSPSNRFSQINIENSRTSELMKYVDAAYNLGLQAKADGYKKLNDNDIFNDDKYRSKLHKFNLLELTSMDAALQGKIKPYPVIGWRYGDMPHGNVSRNYTENTVESGVSVMETSDGRRTQDAISAMFIAASGRPVVYVRGIINTLHNGSDGEPLILEAREIIVE